MPYFIFNMPEVARNLEEYRYLSLPGAHAKAAHNGYVGAQFPWESAWQYYMCTGDQDFMEKYGYELMLDCAKFWASRLEPGDDGKFHINDVVGPDEYKEHVDDT